MELESEVKELDQEKVNHSAWLERPSFRIVLVSTFSALAIVLGYMLANLPNIELFTLTIFLSGFILGKRDGFIVGIFSSFIFCFFNPWGSSPLPLLAFQMFHYSLTGFIGALTRDYLKKKIYFKPDEDLYLLPIMVILGFLGALITISYQIFASLVNVLFFYTIDEFLAYFLMGILFTITHIVGNTLGFTFILPGLIQLIYKMLY
ncbi:MAG: ECF transporter S component [Promethearchaeota archaeon]